MARADIILDEVAALDSIGMTVRPSTAVDSASRNQPTQVVTAASASMVDNDDRNHGTCPDRRTSQEFTALKPGAASPPSQVVPPRGRAYSHLVSNDRAQKIDEVIPSISDHG